MLKDSLSSEFLSYISAVNQPLHQSTFPLAITVTIDKTQSYLQSSCTCKMAPSTDEQFQFLLSCIRYSNHGKVSPNFCHLMSSSVLSNQIDFTKVAEECSIVTRGAAYVFISLKH